MKLLPAATPEIVRLWSIGAINNVVRWIEMLAAALFTLDATGSPFAVAAVTAARSLPMLLFGALTGVLCDALDRKRILVLSMAVTGSASLVIAMLAEAGMVRTWQVAIASFVSGVVWTTDMSARRRMVGEMAAPGMVARVIAMDSLSASVMRMIGPLLGAVLYDLAGLGGAYACTAMLMLGNLLLAWPVRHRQDTRPLALARIPRDLAEGVAAARRVPVVMAVLGVTVAMNVFIWSYTGVVAPIARLVFEAPTALVGALAAGEPLGGIIGGAMLTRSNFGIPPRMMMIGGSLSFVVMLFLMPMAPSYWLACAMLVAGGIGSAGFSNQQTTLILSDAPAAMRSRLLGLTAVCIGTGPFGLLLVGALANALGPALAVQAMAAVGFAALAMVNIGWARADRMPTQAQERDKGVAAIAIRNPLDGS
jgi:MFS family permease